MEEIKLGKYRHYKGHLCDVIGLATHSENHETKLVIYWHPDKDGKPHLWARPKEMFLEKVTIDGVDVPRFQYIGE